ncbi:MAG: hypothetical protein JEZ11_08875 [Desulfobacterales bacterium]|nr:hypothetical protein [Desulfobacterales bacterium]
MTTFVADCHPVLIGSLPVSDHQQAVDMVLAHTPAIPLWVQLPVFKQEGMIEQFLPGMPGLTRSDAKVWIDTAGPDFDDAMLGFYEDYMAVSEGGADLIDSRFAFTPETAPGFFAFLDRVAAMDPAPAAVKGQVTGPVTFCTAVKDQQGAAIFYNDQLRDAAIKLLAMKARWQVRRLSQFDRPVIVFLDEPALAGFGSSEFISISPSDIRACLGEVVSAVHTEGGLAGIHVCANTDWSVILDSSLDIVNFDAYGYFDRFVLYPDLIRAFFDKGKILAWGIVPTSEPEAIETATVESLLAIWQGYAGQLEALGVSSRALRQQSLITPSCGTGSLSVPLAERVLALTRDLSARIRQDF